MRKDLKMNTKSEFQKILDKEMQEFLARGGVIQQGKPRKNPKVYMRVKNNGMRIKHDPTFNSVSRRVDVYV